MKDPPVTLSLPEPVRLALPSRPHYSSVCVGTCASDEAPCRQGLQLPRLTAAGRDLLERIATAHTDPAVESDFYRHQRLRK